MGQIFGIARAEASATQLKAVGGKDMLINIREEYTPKVHTQVCQNFGIREHPDDFFHRTISRGHNVWRMPSDLFFLLKNKLRQKHAELYATYGDDLVIAIIRMCLIERKDTTIDTVDLICDNIRQAPRNDYPSESESDAEEVSRPAKRARRDALDAVSSYACPHCHDPDCTEDLPTYECMVASNPAQFNW